MDSARRTLLDLSTNFKYVISDAETRDIARDHRLADPDLGLLTRDGRIERLTRAAQSLAQIVIDLQHGPDEDHLRSELGRAQMQIHEAGSISLAFEAGD